MKIILSILFIFLTTRFYSQSCSYSIHASQEDKNVHSFANLGTFTPQTLGALNIFVKKLKYDVNKIQSNVINFDTSSVSLIKAIWPFCGTSAADQKWNLLKQTDNDTSFRLTWNTDLAARHNSNGYNVTGTQYADTKLIPSTWLAQDNTTIGLYMIGDTGFVSAAYCTDIGMDDNTYFFGLFSKNYYNYIGGGYAYNITQNNGFLPITNSVQEGLYIATRSASNKFTFYKDKVWQNTNTNAGGNIPGTRSVTIGARNSASIGYSKGTYRLAFAGKAISDSAGVHLTSAAKRYAQLCGSLKSTLMQHTIVQYTPNNLRNDASSSIILQNGNVLTAWTHFYDDDPPEDFTKSSIYAAISTDGGLNYGTPYQIAGIPVGTLGFMIPSLRQQDDGDIIMLCLKQVNTTYNEIWKFISYNNGLTFTDSVLAYSSSIYAANDYYSPRSDVLFETNSGKWVYPYSIAATSEHGSGTGVYYIRFLYSTDEWDTWTADTTTLMRTGAVINTLLVEPQIAYSHDTLVVYARTRAGYVAASRCFDDAITWEHTPRYLKLPASNSCSSFNYYNGQIIAIINRPNGATVNGGSARVRVDLFTSPNGWRWHFVQNILWDEGQNVYIEPSIIERTNDFLIYYSKSAFSDQNYYSLLYSIFLKNKL